MLKHLKTLGIIIVLGSAYLVIEGFLRTIKIINKAAGTTWGRAFADVFMALMMIASFIGMAYFLLMTFLEKQYWLLNGMLVIMWAGNFYFPLMYFLYKTKDKRKPKVIQPTC